MLYDIGDTLAAFLPIERIELLDNGLKAIEAYGLYTTAGQLSMYIEGAEAHDATTIALRVSDIIEEGLTEILNEFEIIVIGSIKEKTRFVRGLREMEQTENSQFIIETITFAETHRAALIDMLAHFTGYGAEYYFPLVGGVSNAFIARLYEVHKARADLLVEDISAVDESVVARCKKFLEAHTHTFLHDAIYEQQYKPGISVPLILSAYRDRLQKLQDNALEQLAIEFVGLMCLTNTMNRNFGISVKDELTEVVEDMSVVARLVPLVDNVMMRLNIYA